MDNEWPTSIPEEMKQDLIKMLDDSFNEYAGLAVEVSSRFFFLRLLSSPTLSVGDIILMMATCFLSGMNLEKFLSESGNLPEEFKNLNLKP